MNIIITGCLGHIGSYLIKNIDKIKKIKKVYLIDNISNNKITALSCLKKSKLKKFFIYDDLSNPNDLFSIKNVDSIIHLASITDAQQSILKKKDYIKNNLGSFENIIKYCKKNKSKLIHISSTSVYGDPNKIVDEESKFLIPQSPYAAIKLKEEKILKNLNNKIKYISLRFGTIAGVSPGMRFHTAVNKFCLNTILGNPIPVWKTALNQYRPYLSLNDAFKTFKFILDKDFFPNETFNILSENKTVKNILNDIKNNGYRPKTKLTESPIMNQLSYKVQKDKIEKYGLKLRSKIENDIKQTLNLFNNLNYDK
tara:strand:- start:670 stop:1602 length:933 start_codon:yes stop_codon:yes gene_type:complete